MAKNVQKLAQFKTT